MLDDSSKMPVMAVIATIELAFPYMKAIADGMPELEINNTRDFLGLVYAGLRCAKQAAITDGEKNVIQEHFDMFISINW